MSELGDRPLWHTCDYIALHARRRPHAAALCVDGRTINFAELHRDLRGATHFLNALFAARHGLVPGSLVAVGFPEFYDHLLATLALERLGMVAAGFRSSERVGLTALLEVADLVLVTEDDLAERCRRRDVLPADWVAAARAAPATTLPPPRPHDGAVVLARSSGTTGRPKMIEITRGMLRARLGARVGALGIGRHARYLATMHFAVGPILLKVLPTLRLGGQVIWESTESVAAAIRRHRPSLVYLLPSALAATLDAIDAMGWSAEDRQPELLLTVGGGKLSPSLRRAALQHLCGRVLETYGSNEAGGICQLDADGVGHADRGIELQVVDVAGGLVPVGDVGEVRVRGPGVARAYRDDPVASARVFRDGWCHVGDHATHVGPGRIANLGRHDDVINVGGLKLNASDLEASIMALADRVGVRLREVAVAPALDEAGCSMLVVAAVGLEAGDVSGLGEAMRGLVSFVFVVVRVAALPRTATGKLRRSELGSLTIRRGTIAPPMAIAS